MLRNIGNKNWRVSGENIGNKSCRVSVENIAGYLQRYVRTESEYLHVSA